MDKLVPTTKLRFVKRRFTTGPGDEIGDTRTILQQWWAEDMPGYMRDLAKGEWHDVEVADENI